jgi:hypothetical protein
MQQGSVRDHTKQALIFRNDVVGVAVWHRCIGVAYQNLSIGLKFRGELL